MEDKPQTNLISPEEIRRMYQSQRQYDTFSALIAGEPKSGKTSLCCTAPKPILFHSFDPDGTTVIETMYPELVASGDILIETFWNDSYKKPVAYKEWASRWDKMVKERFFDKLGTYVIDSCTWWVDSLVNNIALSSKLGPGKLEQDMYRDIYNIIKMHIRMMSDFSCHFLLTAHLQAEKDELTGVIKYHIDTYGRFRHRLPSLFTENYVIQRKSKDDVKILTAPQGFFQAGSQLGAKVFDTKEDPDLKELLKKAGKKYDDKPSLFTT